MYDTVILTNCGTQTVIYRNHYVSFIASDAYASYVARLSVTKINILILKYHKDYTFLF